MKKILTPILAAFIGIITCTNPVKINADLDNPQKKKSLEEKYYEISNLQSQEQEIYDQMVQENADIETDPIELIDENTEYKFVSSCENETYANTIVQSSDGDVYAMIEIDKVTDEITVQINESTYSLNSNGENITLISDDEDIINVVETIYEDESDAIHSSYLGNNTVIGNNIDDTAVATTASTTWLYKSGPFHKTTKMNFEILNILNIAGGAYTCTGHHPVLGTIVFIYGLAVSVGQTVSPTIHIQFYQEHASDCFTYIRETDYYYGAYSESSGTFYEPITTSSGSIKYTYSYFHSVRPDQTGNSACMAYPQ